MPLSKQLQELLFSLMQVKGFGQKRFEKLSAYITVDGKTTLATKVSSPRKARKPATTASK